MPALGWKRWLVIGIVGLAVLLLAAAFVWRDDIIRTSLDPKTPFQTYEPPPAPDYTQARSWALRPGPRHAGSGVDVFFVHPTTYNGGHHWNGPIDEPRSARQLATVMLPNYAGPFFNVGQVYAPRYRQASLYAYLTRRDDAVEARRFAYGDVERAFRLYLARDNGDRPFVIVGVEQGGFLAARLLQDVVGPNEALRRRLVAAYLVRAVVPATAFPPDGPIPSCQHRDQAGCVVAFATAPETGAERAREILGRAMAWAEGGTLTEFEGAALCVNPVVGDGKEDPADRRRNLGAANATDLEWGVRPPILPRQVATRCVDGVLEVSRPKSSGLRASGSWADRLKAPGYNLFFADLEADALARVQAYQATR
jgi:hypothetical protein